MPETVTLQSLPPAALRPDMRPKEPARAVGPQAVEPKAAEALPGAHSTPRVEQARLSITLDEATDTVVYRSVDPKSGDVVWQWPAEQVLRMVEYMRKLEDLNGGAGASRAVDRKA